MQSHVAARDTVRHAAQSVPARLALLAALSFFIPAAALAKGDILGLPAWVVRVKVTDASGKTLAGVEVGASRGQEIVGLGYTDSDGQCLVLVPGPDSVFVRLTGGGITKRNPEAEAELDLVGFVSDERIVARPASRPAQIPVSLLAKRVPINGRLNVRVVDEQGAPVSPAYVYVSVSPRAQRIGMTDADGIAVFQDLPRRALNVCVRAAPGFRNSVARAVTPGDNVHTVTLQPSVSLRVRLLHEAAPPAGTAHVRICTSCTGSWSACVAGQLEEFYLPWDFAESSRVAHAVAEYPDGTTLVSRTHVMNEGAYTISLRMRPAEPVDHLLLKLGMSTHEPASTDELVERIVDLGEAALPALRFAVRHPLAHKRQRSALIDLWSFERRVALWALARVIAPIEGRNPDDVALIRQAAFSLSPECREVGLRAAALLSR